MEQLVRLLPAPQPLWKRCAVATALVLLAFGCRMGLETTAGQYGFIIFILPVTLSALLFDRATGFYAMGLSLALLATLLPWEGRAGSHVAAMSVFVVVATILVLLGEGLHTALVKIHKAEREKDLLLQELSHRIKNKFAMISALLTLESRDAPPDVQKALDKVGTRVSVMAAIHDQLCITHADGKIALEGYLQKLGASLEAQLENLRPITLTVKSPAITTTPQHALAIGLIVNELVTNAFKYAFHENQAGRVSITLSENGSELTLSVTDNGKGCPEEISGGLGTRLVTVLAAQLGGCVSRQSAPQGGCIVAVSFPKEAA